MVARINTNINIRQALNYNENKVKKGAAKLMLAEGFAMGHNELTFSQKLKRFVDLNARNKSEANTLHISLNFSPRETISLDTLKAIASTYMDRIGLGDQPYLVYEHFDASHSHMHIVTTVIQENGRRINTHNIGRVQSSKARTEIEQEFGLVRTGLKGAKEPFVLQPVDLKVVEYGVSETKAAISSVVRSVVQYYKFSSLEEYNAILHQFNVVANPGAEGSRLRAIGGLIYRVRKPSGEILGVPIKASSIAGKPTVKSLTALFEQNELDKKRFRIPLITKIESALHDQLNRQEFVQRLSQSHIHVKFHTNEEHQVYGITFVDNANYVVFKGSALKKEFSVRNILDRLQPDDNEQSRANRSFIQSVLSQTDFSQGVIPVLRQWSAQGLHLFINLLEGGMLQYRYGLRHTGPDNFLIADKRMTTYFQANDITASMLRGLDFLSHEFPTGGSGMAHVLQPVETYPSYPMDYDTTKKKKKRRRRQ